MKFVSERLHGLKHGSLENPHLLLQLNVKLRTQGSSFDLIFGFKAVPGVRGTDLAGVFKSMIQHVGIEYMEKQINFQQHPKGLPEIQ